MTLRKKTLLIISVTLCSLMLIVYTASYTIVLDSFIELEEQDTRRHVDRVLAVLSDDLARLNSTVGDWAPWDDTYEFIEQANSDYVENNLMDATFTNLRLNVMLFLNSDGEFVFGKTFNLGEGVETPVPQDRYIHLAQTPLVLNRTDSQSGMQGILLLPEGVALAASQPILTSNYEGPMRGTLIMGRYLDVVEIDHLATILQLPLSLYRIDDAAMPFDVADVRSMVSAATPVFISALDHESVAGYALIDDMYGKPALIARIVMPRDIYQQGRASIRLFLLALLASGVVLGFILVRLLERTVLSRLGQLNDEVGAIQTGRDLSTRVIVRGADEVAKLAASINAMLTALEQSRQELQRGEGRLRVQAELLDQIQDAIVATDLEGRVTYLNKAAADALKIEQTEMIGNSVSQFGDDPKYGATQQEIVEHTLTHGSWHGTVVNHAGDGSASIFDSRTWLVKDAHGTPTGMIGVSTDITEQTRQEAEIRAILQAANDGFSMADASSGRFLEVNDSYCRMLSYSRDELLTLTIADINPTYQTQEEILQRLEQIKQAGSSLFESSLKRKDSSVIDVEISVNYLDILEGRMVAFVRDITARKEAEEELRKSKKLAEDARYAAESANRAKSEFLSRISHELRTPLNGIMGMTYVALKQAVTPKLRNCLDSIQTESKTLLHLMNDLLDFSDIGTGNHENTYSHFQLDEVLEGVFTQLCQKADAKGLNFSIDIDPEAPLDIIGDSLSLRRILLHIIDNAIKFTDSGTIQVQVSRNDLGQNASEHVSFLFTVSDTGIGIAAEQLSEIFVPFMQVDGSSTRKYGGTGLGLALSKTLAEMMGGRIDVTSEPERGSTFSCTLPFELWHATAERATLRTFHNGGQLNQPAAGSIDTDTIQRTTEQTDTMLELLTQLQDRFSEGNPDVLDRIETLKKYCTTADTQRYVVRLEQQASNYDLAEALETLKHLLAALDLPISEVT